MTTTFRGWENGWLEVWRAGTSSSLLSSMSITRGQAGVEVVGVEVVDGDMAGVEDAMAAMTRAICGSGMIALA